MNKEKLEEFNKELKALLDKYNVTLTIAQQIQVTERPAEIPPVTSETTSSEEAKVDGE